MRGLLAQLKARSARAIDELVETEAAHADALLGGKGLEQDLAAGKPVTQHSAEALIGALRDINAAMPFLAPYTRRVSRARDLLRQSFSVRANAVYQPTVLVSAAGWVRISEALEECQAARAELTARHIMNAAVPDERVRQGLVHLARACIKLSSAIDTKAHLTGRASVGKASTLQDSTLLLDLERFEITARALSARVTAAVPGAEVTDKTSLLQIARLLMTTAMDLDTMLDWWS